MARRLNFRAITGAGVAAWLGATSVSALAAGFTPEGQQHWLMVAHALIDASNAGTDEMGAACKGVTLMGGGSEIRHEYSQVPKWAVNAHFQACIAFQSLASRAHGKGFMTSTDPCKQLTAAVDELGKAKAGVDPDDVVAVAGKLRASLVTLGGDFKDAKTCKLATVRPF